ncbi:hypothetical protein J1614_003079 [Plenodomus biglobosus]|nr:hypothetical protein J1614_003079 [Plenodomus biglobosus]
MDPRCGVRTWALQAQSGGAGRLYRLLVFSVDDRIGSKQNFGTETDIMATVLEAAQDRRLAAAQSAIGGVAGNEYNFPAFDNLPKVEGMPQGNIWGFFDKDGKKDEVGSMCY